MVSVRMRVDREGMDSSLLQVGDKRIGESEIPQYGYEPVVLSR